jgi:hypothetical protein
MEMLLDWSVIADLERSVAPILESTRIPFTFRFTGTYNSLTHPELVYAGEVAKLIGKERTLTEAEEILFLPYCVTHRTSFLTPNIFPTTR